MRDYSNMPVMKWEDTNSAKKAMAQVHHAEPVIIEMPESFVMALDADNCGCKTTDDPHLHVDCSMIDTLKTLADENQLPELNKLAEIAHEANQVVDIDTNKRRIIIHD